MPPPGSGEAAAIAAAANSSWDMREPRNGVKPPAFEVAEAAEAVTEFLPRLDRTPGDVAPGTGRCILRLRVAEAGPCPASSLLFCGVTTFPMAIPWCRSNKEAAAAQLYELKEG